MKKLMKRLGWWRTDDGRWFRRCNEDGTEKRGIHSVEVSWGKGPFGPHLGITLTTNDGYSDNHKLYIGFLLGRVWIGNGTVRPSSSAFRASSAIARASRSTSSSRAITAPSARYRGQRVRRKPRPRPIA